ncbi:MAG: RtcB family protein [Deltaproteobacteria bacterium]|nr:RtcB family protein [Deltaproteobacteria bacterium]
MLVPGRIFASAKLIHDIRKDKSLEQVMNVATLPGIQKYSIAMPDIHWGYGFPIGGVAAMDVETGVISPGGIGFDINCGIRLLKTPLTVDKVKNKMKEIVAVLFNNIPCGVGSEGVAKCSTKDLQNIVKKGAAWAIENSYGLPSDIDHIEENGCLTQASLEFVSDRAIKRGALQLGSLGSGNHFLEVGVIDKIYNSKVAEAFGLFQNQITIMIHSGSRGFGHQICTDFLDKMQTALKKYEIYVPDRQLACTPLASDEAHEYLSSMAAAANFAWTNRQVMMHKTREVFESVLGVSQHEMQLLYDVCHNIAKFETYEIDGVQKKLCVHRKGATRAFGPNVQETPEKYRHVGQPVIVPGDMGRSSFVLVGTEKAMNQSFGSSCHGAGRQLSRREAVKQAKGRAIYRELEDKGVYVLSKGRHTLAEEMPQAYKDVETVVDSMDIEGLTYKVARIRPLGCIKG